MHGNLTGAYDIRHVKIRNRIVLTNKTPTGLNRGFGGPQAYYPLERLMQRIADRAETRSAGGHSPQSRSRERDAIPDRDRRACSIPEISRRRSTRPCATAGSTSCWRAATRRARKAGTTASALPPSSSQAFRIWATSPPRSLPKNASAPGPRTAPKPPPRSVSIRSAPSRCKSPRRRKARAIAPCWRKWLPMCSA